MNGSKKYKLATENLVLFSFSYNGYPVLLLRTIRKISRGEMLGWDYGEQYWRNHPSSLRLFSTQGEILSPDVCRAINFDVDVCIGSGSCRLNLSLNELLFDFSVVTSC